ncbi:helix-turn-helix transcriptional regulator [Clostridium sp. C8-1-8]|uniref:helix-turn-helix transcriptional regulator n=1 Tax=Clostridium sp. C8-1-8 TaxID=2698831 RepID=UPI00136AE9E8|nr:helix-turn-helix transcriptional regulator [Clostridium sp. C8-1-8]
MDFFYPSEKIKLMRKKFRVNQSELETENMTRAYISMMESGKRNVTKSSSKMLAEKFNHIASRIHANLNLDDDYFFRQPKDDARYYCSNELNFEKNITHQKLDELAQIELDYHLDDLLAETYARNGKMYLAEKDYNNAYIYLNNSLGMYKELRLYTEQPDIYKKLGACKIAKGDYEDALFFFNQAIAYAEKVNDIEIFIKASHDLAIAYAGLKQFNKCLDTLEKNILRNKLASDHALFNSAKFIKANILFENGSQSEAVKEYFELAEKIRASDEVTLGVIYNNIAEYYYNITDYSKSLNYISEAQRVKMKSNKRSLSSTLALKSKVLLAQGYYDESLLLIELAIDMAEQYMTFNILIDNYKYLVKILEIRKDYGKIKEKMNRLLITSKDYNLESGKSYSIFKLAEVASLEGNREDSITLLHELESYL